jgi:hypothetical protein
MSPLHRLILEYFLSLSDTTDFGDELWFLPISYGTVDSNWSIEEYVRNDIDVVSFDFQPRTSKLTVSRE